ncbi:RagB/SusD family nutrient uptake outer membrane protein [Phocaeicola sp.]
MKLTKILYITGIVAGCSFLSSCNDDYLQKSPEDGLNQESFFNSVADLETYTNGFYGMVGASYDDLYSDNIGHGTGDYTFSQKLKGRIDEKTIGSYGWKKDGVWSNIYNINFMLVNADKAVGDEKEKKHYIGLARLCRALQYYGIIKNYGSAPWYSTPIANDDEDALYKPQDSRELVVDSVMADLQYACDYMEEGSSRTRLTRYAALGYMARIALYEGTFRKYHTEVSDLASTANSFLEKAVWASNEIMQSGQFEITGEGAAAYRDLFVNPDLSKNKEMILFADYDRDLSRKNNTSSVLNWQWNLSRSLADSYLKLDGTPITDADRTKTFVDMFTDRDPRMAETIMYPGFINEGNNATIPTKIVLDYGGLGQIKFLPRTDATYGGWNENITDLPIIRYAEVLLTNAEAKAELGTLTQNDLNETVNLIRKRVGMPDMKIDVAIDPVLEQQYPNVGGALKNVILEIRRERRVELACEGFRYGDTMRWAVGEIYNQPFEGVYLPGFGVYDSTGDGVPDVALFKSPNDKMGYSDADLLDITVYYTQDEKGGNKQVYLSEGDKGNIRFYSDADNDANNFISPKYYYYPLSQDETKLNPNLKQPIGWE